MMNSHLGHIALMLFILPLFVWTGGGEKYSVPSWAGRVVWYQIFPERFRNGDRSNDPVESDLIGSWPHDIQGPWNVSPWGSDWYELQSWESANGKGFYVNTQRRRYGGDLQGIIDKLDYLKKLNISALYLNPIFESPSLHKYDATMYHHVDNNFGPDPERDRRMWSAEDPSDPATWQWTSADSLFLVLIKECHRREIKIILDGVFNHVGLTFWAFKDVQKNNRMSPYKDWFVIKKFDDTTTATNEFEYEGWYGVRELPELNEVPAGFPRSLKDHLRAVVTRWMDPDQDGNPEDGIDGWRLDVANMVSIDFWKEFRQWTRAVNPESYLVGEVWWEDWTANKMFDPAPWIADGTVYDAVMNYRMMMPLLDFCANKKKKISASVFMERLQKLQSEFPSDVTRVQMNTIDSHDTDRLPSIIVNPDRVFDHAASAKDDPNYDVRKPDVSEIAVQKMILTLQFVMTGAPSIYYGSEAGMWGGDDPDERKPMIWQDIAFAAEKIHPLGKIRPVDAVSFDNDLFTFYQKLIRLRYDNEALATGTIVPISVNDIHDLVVFSKKATGNTIMVIVNNGEQTRKVSVKSVWPFKSAVMDLLTGRAVPVRKGTISVDVPPKHVTVVGDGTGK